MTDTLGEERAFEDPSDQRVFKGRVLNGATIHTKKDHGNLLGDQVVSHQRKGVVITQNGNVGINVCNFALDFSHFLWPFRFRQALGVEFEHVKVVILPEHGPDRVDIVRVPFVLEVVTLDDDDGFAKTQGTDQQKSQEE